MLEPSYTLRFFKLRGPLLKELHISFTHRFNLLFFVVFRSIVLSWLVLIALSTLIAVLTKVINLEQLPWSKRVAIAVLIGLVPGLKASVMVRR